MLHRYKVAEAWGVKRVALASHLFLVGVSIAAPDTRAEVPHHRTSAELLTVLHLEPLCRAWYRVHMLHHTQHSISTPFSSPSTFVASWQHLCRAFFLLSAVVWSGCNACEPEIGKPCRDDPELIKELVNVVPGSNDLVQNPRFENCSQALCLSADGSRPFCTKPCNSDLDCVEAPGFVCEQVVEFGPLACRDYTPETDCTAADGTPSEQPIKYCTAAVGVIIDRDKQYGRNPDGSIVEDAGVADAGTDEAVAEN